MIVLDASIALAWVLPDEQSDLAENTLRDVLDDGATVPPVWALEVTNALLSAELRGRLTKEQSNHAIALLRDLDIRVALADLSVSFGAAWHLARHHGMTSYDASYLELAVRLGYPLATLDDRLRRTAAEAGVPLA